MKVGEWMREEGLKWSERARLMMKVLEFDDPAEVLMCEERELKPAELSELEIMRARLLVGEPLAYVLGEAEFYGRKWKVGPAVLIPRPETEELVQVAAREIRRRMEMVAELERGAADEWGRGRIVVAEVGVGSGCLIGSVAREIDNVVTEFVAVDISEPALRVAEENLREMKVKLFQGDLLEGWQAWQSDKAKSVDKNNEAWAAEILSGGLDVILANLPYVDRQWEWNSPGLKYEPEVALYAEDGGLGLIFRLMKQARSRLKAGGVLILELDKSQKARAWAELKCLGYIEVNEIGAYGLSARVPKV